MNDFTRIRKYKSKNGHDRTSKSTLDLIFANVGIQPHVKSSKVTKINAPKNQTIDHHAVACVLDFPSLPKFIFVKTPNDPLRRPEPNAQTTQKIRQPLAQIQVAETDDYDNVMLKLKGVLDELIPTNSPYESTTKKLWRTPIDATSQLEIEKKHRLECVYRANPTEENRIARNIQRNKVTALVRKKTQKNIPVIA